MVQARRWSAFFCLKCGIALLVLALAVCPVHAAPKPTLRVATLSFGTVSWELDTLKRHELARKHGFELVHIPVATPDAATIALQGKAADIIVTDWFWVSRQRAAHRDYRFFPHTLASGALMVRADLPIRSVAELGRRRIGVAGGPTDKSWLLLQAYARNTYGLDIAQAADVEFAAPPTLNELLLRGRLDAALNFWHYSARLRAAGQRQLITVRDMLRGLGVDSPIPLLGWVFDGQWAVQHRALLEAFLAASSDAKHILATDDAEWEHLRPLMKVKDDATFRALRDDYREGIPSPGMKVNQAQAAKLYARLGQIGGKKLVGDSPELSPGVFWESPHE